MSERKCTASPNRQTPQQNLKQVNDASNAVKYSPSRISKEELALLLALWAEYKPDCRERRDKIEEINIKKEEEDQEKDQKYVFPSDAGVCVISADDKILMVEGSGSTHAAVTVCARLPSHLLSGATVYLSRFPCTMCMKVLLQAHVKSIIVAQESYAEIDRDKRVNNTEENLKQLEEKLRKTVLKAAAASKHCGLSHLHKNEPKQRPNLLELMSKKLESFKRKKDKYHFWIMGCSIIAAYRSEDLNLQVGACLAKCQMPSADGKPGKIITYGVAYNGTIQRALDLDFPNPEEKGKFSMHAEQNLFIYNAPHIPEDCDLYTTHSPCTQCAQLVSEYGIRNTYYISKYRKENFECEMLLEPSDLNFSTDFSILSLLRGHSVKEVFERLHSSYKKDSSLANQSNELKKKRGDNYQLEFNFLTAEIQKLLNQLPKESPQKKYSFFLDWYKAEDKNFNQVRIYEQENLFPQEDEDNKWKTREEWEGYLLHELTERNNNWNVTPGPYSGSDNAADDDDNCETPNKKRKISS